MQVAAGFKRRYICVSVDAKQERSNRRPRLSLGAAAAWCLFVCLFVVSCGVRPLVCWTWFAAHGLLRVVYLHAACCMLRVARCLLSARSCILNIGLHAASRLELHCGTRSLRATVRAAGCWSTSACPLRPCRRCSPSARCHTCATLQRCNGAQSRRAACRTCSLPTHARTRTHAHAHMRARTHTHSHARAHTRTHPSTRTQTHERRNTRMHARTYEQACAHIHRRTRTHSHRTAAAAAGWVATGTSRNGKQKDGDNGDRLQ